MHEHGGEDLHRACHRVLGKLSGDEGPLPDEWFASGKLNKEHRQVQADKDKRDIRSDAPLGVVVTDWEHAGLPLAGSNP
jgi:hypothetical protein